MDDLVDNQHGLRFLIVDGSTVQEPGAKGTTYRLHIAMDLINMSLRQVEVTTDKEGEHLGHYAMQKGDVVVIDRGYNQPSSLVPWISAGGDVVLRYNAHGMRLHERNAEKAAIDWEERLRTCNGKAACIPVTLRQEGQSILGYVHAIPLPPEKAQEARRKAKQRAEKKGGTASAKTLYLAEWVFIFTSLPPEIMHTKTIAALYRVRWQVELVIKRLKSVLSIDLLRARKHSDLAALYLHGKLLFAAVLQKVSHRWFAPAKRTMDAPREITDWRLWQSVRDVFKAALVTCFPARKEYVADAIKSLRERPRKRKLQQAPSPIFALLRPPCVTHGVLDESMG